MNTAPHGDLLRVEHLRAQYGRAQILFGVSPADPLVLAIAALGVKTSFRELAQAGPSHLLSRRH